jgi:hypothetical protein
MGLNTVVRTGGAKSHATAVTESVCARITFKFYADLDIITYFG